MKYFIDTEFHEYVHRPFHIGKPYHTVELISIGIKAEDGREYYAVSKDFNLNRAWNSCQRKPEPLLPGQLHHTWVKEYWLRDNVLNAIHTDLCKKESMFSKTYYWDLYEKFKKKSLQRLIRWHGKTNAQIARDVIAFVNPEIDKICDIYKYSYKWNERDYKDEFEYVKLHNTVLPDKNSIFGELHNKLIFGESATAYNKPEFYGYFSDYDWVAVCGNLFGKMISLPKGFPMYCLDLKQMMNERGLSQDWKRKNCPENPEKAHHALEDARWNFDLYQTVINYSLK